MHSQNRGSSLKQSQKKQSSPPPPLKHNECILQINTSLVNHLPCYRLSPCRQAIQQEVWRPSTSSSLTRFNGFDASHGGGGLPPSCVQCCESSWDTRPVLAYLQAEWWCTVVPLRQRQGLHPCFCRRCKRHRRSNGYRLAPRTSTRNNGAVQDRQSLGRHVGYL